MFQFTLTNLSLYPSPFINTLLIPKTSAVFKMFSLPLQLLLAIFILKISDSQKISFQNVTIKWKNNSKIKTIIASADNLKKIIPSEEEVSVLVKGDVPVLYEQSVYDIHNLTSLRLDSVHLGEIKPGAFGNLPLLRSLDLSFNQLTEIKSGTFTNLNLSEINLGSNRIRSLRPGAFKNVTVQELKLGENSLTEIPSGVFDNVAVSNLNLGFNSIHTVAPNTLSTISLTNLVLSHNQLETFDLEILGNPELTSLDLNDNLIKFLRPGDLKDLPRLNKLILSNNKLTEIPDGVFKNTNIAELRLQGNKIAKISTKAFDDMPKLHLVDISMNDVTLWDSDWLAGSSEPLVFLFASNKISEIPGEAFKNYHRLGLLNLSNNKIAMISMKAFRKLPHIGVLDLSSNEIDNWSPDLLANVNITRIDLRMNRLKCIEENLDKVFGNGPTKVLC